MGGRFGLPLNLALACQGSGDLVSNRGSLLILLVCSGRVAGVAQSIGQRGVGSRNLRQHRMARRLLAVETSLARFEMGGRFGLPLNLALACQGGGGLVASFTVTGALVSRFFVSRCADLRCELPVLVSVDGVICGRPSFCEAIVGHRNHLEMISMYVDTTACLLTLA